MKDVVNKLSEPLNKNDIELRVGNVSQGGLSLLAYKTARTDVNRLNKVCGLNWRNEHFYDDKGLLCCRIALYNEDTGEWIAREDVGVESAAEKEKGSYSDSFKRAGFRWGIGVELYNSPFIFIKWQTQKEGNRFKPVGFFASNLKITKYKIENHEPKFEISYNGNVVWSNFGVTQKQETGLKIDNNQIMEIEGLINEVGADKQGFLNHFKINKIDDMQMANYQLAIKMLNRKKATQRKLVRTPEIQDDPIEQIEQQEIVDINEI